MKRPKKDVPDWIVWRTFPLFKWRPCAVCEHEFRREFGWYSWTRWTRTRRGTRVRHAGGKWIYLCRACAPSKDEAKRFAHEHSKRPSRPPTLPKGVSLPPAPRGGTGQATLHEQDNDRQ